MNSYPVMPPIPPCFTELGPILDVICPMCAIIDASGRIAHVGPTLRKLRPGERMIGRAFLEVFDLKRPKAATSDELLALAGDKLHLHFRSGAQTALKALLARLPEGRGAVVNLGFGISIVDAVRDYALVGSDFAATDLAIELLYLVEAKSAAMAASRKLNQRLQGAKIAAEEQAFTDTLTGLKNRRAMDHVLGRMLASNTPFALMHLDLDFFKSVNDTLGHAAGDHVLQNVAHIMVEETRASDTVARVGGDEFVILFERLTERAALERTACRIIEKLEVPMPFGRDICRVSASCGTVLSVDYDRPEGEQMLADADVALYAAKHSGRGQHKFFIRDDARKADAHGASYSTKAPDLRARNRQNPAGSA